VSPAGFRDVLDTKITRAFLMARQVVPRMLNAGSGLVVTISMNEPTMQRRGLPYGSSGRCRGGARPGDRRRPSRHSGARQHPAPGRRDRHRDDPDELDDEARSGLLDPAIMGPPIVWLASAEADGVDDERIVATEFEEWLARR
jgi:gluconate 5-dehydrogenase